MKKILDKAVEMGIQEGEIFYLNNIKEEIGFENSQLKTVNSSQNAGIAFRGIKDGKMGYVTSSNLDNAEQIAHDMLEVINYSPKKEFNFSQNKQVEHKNYGNDEIWNVPMEKLIEDGHKAIDLIKKYDDEVLVSVQFAKEKQEINIVNTNDVNLQYKKNNFSLGMGGSLIQGTSFIQCGISEKNGSGKYDIRELAEKTIEKISMAKQDCSFEAGNKPAIFTPSAMLEILITLQQGISGDTVARGISPLCGKIGERILSDKITLIDDGTMEDGVSSMPFDDEGVPAQKSVLVQNGVLKSYIHSLKTAAKLGYAPTGNGLRTQDLFTYKKYDIAPKPDITNWIMAPGNVKYEDMIADIKDGIIIDNIMGIFMNNLINGDFAGNIGMGYAIKNGKIAGRVKDAAINANIYDVFLNNVVALSDKSYKCSLFDFIGTHVMPYVMLKDINIAGKK
jgi:PmbA protein